MDERAAAEAPPPPPLPPPHEKEGGSGVGRKRKRRACQKRCRGRKSRHLLVLALLMGLLVFVGVVNLVVMKVLYVAFKSDPTANDTGGGGGANASSLSTSGGGRGSSSGSRAMMPMLTTGPPSNATAGPGDGSKFSFFVNQGINFLYCVFGAFMVYPRLWCCNDITPEMRRGALHKHYALLAFIDSFGTFFLCMGAVYTPGQIQPLLNQALIPLTMAFSFFMLRARYSVWELLGAVLMLGGAAVSIVPTLTDDATADAKWYACLIYFCSNIPMAVSCVLKEKLLRGTTVDVWYMANWISIYQFTFSFGFVPLLTVPFIGGTESGMSWAEVWVSFRDGCLCWLQLLPQCAGARDRGQTWLLPGFTLINMSYTLLGLFVTKHGSAVMSRLSYALILPLTAAAFALPFMGPYQEVITGYTIAGLGVTLVGFALYQWATERARRRRLARRAKEERLGGVVTDSTNAQMLRDPLLDDGDSDYESGGGGSGGGGGGGGGGSRGGGDYDDSDPEGTVEDYFLHPETPRQRARSIADDLSRRV